MTKKLYDTDYVLFNPITEDIARFSKSSTGLYKDSKYDPNGDIVLYWDKDEATQDALEGDIVTRCTDLPQKYQDEIIEQLGKY